MSPENALSKGIWLLKQTIQCLNLHYAAFKLSMVGKVYFALTVTGENATKF